MSEGKRRIDKIMDPEYTRALEELDIDEVRRRRDDTRAELDHLSMLRRYVQVRAEILKGELDRRSGGGVATDESLVDHLAEIMTQEGQYERLSRGGAIRLTVPDDEMLLARRRVERLVAEQGVTDPTELSDDDLATAAKELAAEERTVSDDRAAAIEVLTALQEELKRRFKEDPTAAIVG